MSGGVRTLIPAFWVVMMLASVPGCGTVGGDATGGGVKTLPRPDAVEQRVVELVNDARSKGRKCGAVQHRPAPPLRWDDKLARAALEHSRDMARRGFLGHKGPDGRSAGDRVAQLGYRWSAVGENVGQGPKTPEEAVRRWLESERHCRNIMSPEFREAGAASAQNSSLRTYWTLVFGTKQR